MPLERVQGRHLLMHEASADLFRQYQEAAGGHVLYTTLAPEVPGVPELIPQLEALGITCAIGHSGAGYDLSWACVNAGAKAATHVGNAMRLFHQHEPAIFGVALESDIYAETICDGRHLVPGTVRLYVKAKGWDRLLGITDSIMAAGLPDGNYKLGVNDVVVEDGDAKLASTGVRAGSTLTQATALRNFMKFTGAPVEKAAKPLSENPARLFGWTDRGRIAVGAHADLVLMDDSYDVVRTWADAPSTSARSPGSQPPSEAAPYGAASSVPRVLLAPTRGLPGGALWRPARSASRSPMAKLGEREAARMLGVRCL